MANDAFTPKWRNFVVWSIWGAVLYALNVFGVLVLLDKDILSPALRSPWRLAVLGLTLLTAMAVLGFVNRKRPVTPRNLRSFLFRDVMAVIACLVLVWGFAALGSVGALDRLGASEWAAMVVGAALVAFASLGALLVASARTRIGLVDDEAAEDLRDRSRLMFYSFAWTAACGALLIGLSLAGPRGVLPPLVTLIGALMLVALMTVLGIATWRLSDELGRTLSIEAGNVAFYLILMIGGAWQILAHLGLAVAPAPLDWLTMFTLLLFAASLLATGRRKLLTH